MGSSSIKKKKQSSNNFSFLPPTLRSQIKIFPNILAKVLKKKKITLQPKFTQVTYLLSCYFTI